jgi:hypothetical protein
MLFHLGRGGGAEPVGAEALQRFSTGGGAYLTIDLAADPLPASARVWRVECDGAGLEPGLLAAAFAGRSPTLRVLGPAGPLASARPGSERAGLVKSSFEEMLERAATLIEAALDGAAAEPPSAMPDSPAIASPPAVPGGGRVVKRAAAAVARRAQRAAYAALCHSPHWRVGWRRGEGGLRAEGLGAGWMDLPDDGRRFYADPFALVWRGRTFLFVEDFEHRLGKGIISVVEFGRDGPLGAPQPALERPEHLSYPFVFERDGEVWMIPESGGAGTVDLYRAREFPFSWKLERTLVEGVFASDATLVEHGGRWWMFATAHDGGAYSDVLWLWSAPDFRGPWTAHPRNPVLIDIASARPAGRMFQRDGALWRPVQDCRAGYGAAMALARVDRLDDGGFSQTVVSLFGPCQTAWPGRRLHTYNAAGGFEFIDGSGLAPRWPALRRPLALAGRRELRPAPA